MLRDDFLNVYFLMVKLRIKVNVLYIEINCYLIESPWNVGMFYVKWG